MTTKLMDTFDFTKDDLAYNRRAEYSPRQKAGLSKTIQGTRRIFLVLALVSFAIAVYLALPFIQTMSLLGNNSRLIGILGLLGLSALFIAGVFDRNKFEITQVEGRAQFISRDSTIDHDGQLITETNFYILIGENEFSVDSGQYDAFTQGHIYRVYIGQTNLLSTGILSIDYLGPPT